MLEPAHYKRFSVVGSVAASLFSAPFTVKINSTVHGGRGGCLLSAAARTASAADYVEQRSVLVSPSNPCGGHSEHEGRPFVLYGEWRLHPQVVWQRYGQGDVDLFALQENAHCPLFFSLSNVSAPLGVDALAHLWPNVLLYVPWFNFSNSGSGSSVAIQTMDSRGNPASGG